MSPDAGRSRGKANVQKGAPDQGWVEHIAPHAAEQLLAEGNSNDGS
jgi:hypothetical protein